MTTGVMTSAELADWLSRLNSHGVYPAVLLQDLPGDLAAQVPTETTEEIFTEMAGRQLGGHLRAGVAGRQFTGYRAAQALATYRLGRDPAAGYYGRGLIHRTCIAALRADAD